MFDEKLSRPAVLLERLSVSAREENRAAADQLAAMGELFAVRWSAQSELWVIDAMEAVGAEVAA
ncbi:DUF222 domain-containing protein, partial [Mycobacterium sp. 050134]